MADDKYFLEDEDSEWGDGILINEYKGKWSALKARKDKQEKVWYDSCFPMKRDGSKKPMEKHIPMGIPLGRSKEAAAAFLRALADKIDGSPF